MTSTRDRRFTGRQFTVMFAVGCLTLVLLPWGAWAAGTKLVTLASPNGNKVTVTKDNALQVATLQGGKPFQINGSSSGGVTVQLLGHGKLAITDLVVSHDDTGNERLNATFAVYAGDATCTAVTGQPLGYLVDYGYFPVETINTVHLTTPLVVTATNVCLYVSAGNPAGLIATWTVGGYQP